MQILQFAKNLQNLQFEKNSQNLQFAKKYNPWNLKIVNFIYNHNKIMNKENM